jgi:tetrahydromethanopterin S-methyltransferase subunit B
MRAHHAHPAPVDQWPVEHTVGLLVDMAATTRRIANVTFGIAIGALAVAITALCLAIR